MRLPLIRGVIDRRLLVNYRTDPAILARLLPAPFRPQVVRGFGIAGICLIRLARLRPAFLPAWAGVGSENTAHRIAVEWDHGGARRGGVFIPRRDTSSRLVARLGGRIFPGLHHHARFTSAEGAGRYRVTLDSDDGQTHVHVDGVVAAALPAGSVFRSLAEASTFFERGAVGYSPAAAAGAFDGLELRTAGWAVEPLAVTRVAASFFEDRGAFPAGAAELDCALLMRDVDHAWHNRETLCGEGAGGTPPVGQRCRARRS